MRSNHVRTLLCTLMLAAAATAAASVSDHREFDATLHAPYQAGMSGARTFTLNFDYPMAPANQPVSWRIELVAPSGKVVQHWRGALRLKGKPETVSVRWGGRRSSASMPDGVYRVRMRARSRSEVIEQS